MCPRTFDASIAASSPIWNGRFTSIVLKNSDFRFDHNSEDRWRPRWKIPWGFGGRAAFAACDPSIGLAVATTGLDHAIGSKTRILAVTQFPSFSTLFVDFVEKLGLRATAICFRGERSVRQSGSSRLMWRRPTPGRLRSSPVSGGFGRWRPTGTRPWLHLDHGGAIDRA